MNTRLTAMTAIAVLSALSACGQLSPVPASGTGPDANRGLPEGGVVRGRWQLSVGGPESGSASFLASALASTPMTGTVAASVSFALSAANFAAPASPSGVASYGTLDVTALTDNDLRVCGATGKVKCTSAVIRVYTSGAPGAGLWNTVDQYGLPITSGGATVGLGASGALAVSTLAIPSNKHVLSLADFTAGAALQIPLAVDFSDAAAGSYATTVVVEYALF